MSNLTRNTKTWWVFVTPSSGTLFFLRYCWFGQEICWVLPKFVKCYNISRKLTHFARPARAAASSFVPWKNDRMSSTAPRRNYSRRMRMWSIVRRVKCFHVINFSTAPSSSPSSLLSLTPFRRRPRAHRWRRRRRRRRWLRMYVDVSLDKRKLLLNAECGVSPNRLQLFPFLLESSPFTWQCTAARWRPVFCCPPHGCLLALVILCTKIILCVHVRSCKWRGVF